MSGWQTKRLGDVLQLNYGKSLPVKSRVEGPIPVYGSNGVVGSHTEAIVDAPGLIVGRKGSAGQVHLSRGPFCPIDTTFYVTANDAPDTDLEFLFYLPTTHQPDKDYRGCWRSRSEPRDGIHGASPFSGDTPRAEEDRAHPFDGAAGHRSAGADHSDHHRAEKGPHAQALHRGPPQRTAETD